MDSKEFDPTLWDKEAIEYILSLEPIKPSKEQYSGGLFNLEGPKSFPLFGDIYGISYDYWG